jgi:hypothetical protein
LFSVILEFRQEYFSQPRKSKGYLEKGEPILLATELSKSRKALKIFAIIMAVTGTLIWGYGDLLIA